MQNDYVLTEPTSGYYSFARSENTKTFKKIDVFESAYIQKILEKWTFRCPKSSIVGHNIQYYEFKVSINQSHVFEKNSRLQYKVLDLTRDVIKIKIRVLN